MLNVFEQKAYAGIRAGWMKMTHLEPDGLQPMSEMSIGHLKAYIQVAKCSLNTDLHRLASTVDMVLNQYMEALAKVDIRENPEYYENIFHNHKDSVSKYIEALDNMMIY